MFDEQEASEKEELPRIRSELYRINGMKPTKTVKQQLDAVVLSASLEKESLEEAIESVRIEINLTQELTNDLEDDLDPYVKLGAADRFRTFLSQYKTHPDVA